MFFKSLDSIIKQHILLHKGTSENWEAYRALIEFICLHLGYRGLTEALLCTEYIYSKAVNGVLRIDKRPMYPQGYILRTRFTLVSWEIARWQIEPPSHILWFAFFTPFQLAHADHLWRVSILEAFRGGGETEASPLGRYTYNIR